MDGKISEILRLQLQDLDDLYRDAKQNENGALMEKLSKSVADMARKVREQETHEKETISRNEFLELIGEVFEAMGAVLATRLPDDSFRAELINEIADVVAELGERRFTPDD